MSDEKPFASVEMGELRGLHVRWLICGGKRVKAWGLQLEAPDEMAEIINVAYQEKVKEAMERCAKVAETCKHNAGELGDANPVRHSILGGTIWFGCKCGVATAAEIRRLMREEGV